jgi:predicted acyl esterase
VFVYDPAAPVPSLGGSSCCFPDVAPMGPADQRPIEATNSLLVYTSGPLEQDLLVAGPISVRLYAATTATTLTGSPGCATWAWMAGV